MTDESGGPGSGEHWEGAAPEWIDWARAPSLLESTREAGSARSYVLADAAALPFRTGAFDRVVAYNVLMDVPDMPRSVAEAGRVLAPGGTLTVSLVHPFADRGRFTGDEPDAPFTITGSYFGREHFSARVTEGEHSMPSTAGRTRCRTTWPRSPAPGWPSPGCASQCRTWIAYPAWPSGPGCRCSSGSTPGRCPDAGYGVSYGGSFAGHRCRRRWPWPTWTSSRQAWSAGPARGAAPANR